MTRGKSPTNLQVALLGVLFAFTPIIVMVIFDIFK